MTTPRTPSRRSCSQ
jgi:hypothetical protein